MNNSCLNVAFLQNNNLNNIVDLFIKKNKKNVSITKFTLYIEQTTNLIDSLIDICIKNKIIFWIDNKISFSSIKKKFKLQLENILLSCVQKKYHSIKNNINNVILQDLNNWTYFIDIISINKIKNKVSFNPISTEYNYNELSNSVKIVLHNSKENNLSIEQTISIYMKIIFMNEHLISLFREQIYLLCESLNNITTHL
jgi:hypothetical protein